MSGPAEAFAESLMEKVEKMVRVLLAKKWDEFPAFFSKDLYYKVGAAEPLHGPEAARDFLAGIYTKLEFTGHDVRGFWQFADVVIIEMDANYKVIEDGRSVKVPCCDVYRFEGGLIKEWRVYPDTSQIGVRF